MTAPRVMIFEDAATGHRLHYVRACVQAISDLGVEIVLATGSSTPKTDEFRTHVGPVLDRLVVDPSYSSEATTPLRSARRRVASYRSAVKRHAPDHVYVPYADGFAQVGGLMRPLGGTARLNGLEVEGILMRGRFAYPKRSARDVFSAYAWLAATSLAPVDVFHFVDPIPYERIAARGGWLASKTRLIPEPVEPHRATDRIEARRRLGLPLEGRVICCPGWLDPRKGADRLIRAFVSAGHSLRREDRLLLVGQMDEPVRKAVEEARGSLGDRLLLHEGVRSDEHLHLAIAASDVVAAPYPRHVGSSGIVVRAAALERMLLASDFGWVGMVTERFALGMTCDCRDEEGIARALPAALEASGSFRPSAAAARFTRFHSQANHERHLSRRLRERLGAAGGEELFTWAQVIERAASERGPAPAANLDRVHVGTATIDGVPPCPLCGHRRCERRGEILHPTPTRVAGVEIDLCGRSFQLWRCPSCTFQFKDPPIDEGVLMAAYRNASAGQWEIEPNPVERQFEMIRAAAERYMPLESGLERRCVLDVGCGNGALLAQFGSQWVREAFEPGVEAAELAKQRGIDVLGPVLGDSVPEARWDVILAIDLVEHFATPNAFFEKAAHGLKPGGVLVVLTGDTGSPSWRWLGSRYWYCSLVEHFSFFSRRSLQWIGRRNGLQSIEFRRMSHIRTSARQQATELVKNLGYGVLQRIGWLPGRALRKRLLDRRGPGWISARDHLLCVMRHPA